MHKIEIEATCNLAEHLRNQRLPLKMSCGGHGSCRTCRVMLDGEPVLACQTEVQPGEYDITIPESAASSANIQIDLSTLEEGLICETPRWKTLSVEVPEAETEANASNRQRLEKVLPQGISLSPHFFDTISSDAIEGPLTLACFDSVARFPIQTKERRSFAIAVDIGTTTLAAALIDLNSRSLIACNGRLNAQYAYSEDLVARIAFCHTPELLEEMRDLGLKHTLIPLVKHLLKEANVSRKDLLATVLSGNSPMIHILLGLDPTGMGGWPFNGIDYAPPPRPASDHGLPGEHLEFIPSKSAYLGGDIVSGLALIDFANAPDGTLFVDLGTNAEIALKAGGKILCTAVPAGPSFEGGGFPCGVSAIPGAIDHVWEDDGNLRYSTIGDEAAIGLCGSGIISFVAAAFRARILRKKGRYARRNQQVEERELVGHLQRVFPITDEVYISEEDINAFLQAKAAVFSGIITLCKIAELDLADLDKLYLAGNFGKRVRTADLMDIGIIPPIPADKIEACGNTSLKGAIYSTLDQQALSRMQDLITKLEFIELNAQATFQDDFINALFIPHLKLDFGLSKEA
ncbi:2Fe-2S iron-sulfur cluster binding domain protein [Verrucomicrobiia bacterium DG1235]|nr:2Fe-2S iron-sulfur cluster binding domain protein [Verrucomicrobiae bacterium DG1235]